MTVIIEPGAPQFHLGLGIIVPTTGVIRNFTLDLRGVEWAVAQQLFVGGDATNTEFQGSTFLFKDSAIDSTVSDPLGLKAKLSSNSTFTVEGTTISVSGTTVNALHFPSTVSDGSTIAIQGSKLIATSTGSGIARGLYLAAATSNANVSVRDTAVTASTPSNSGSGTHGVYFNGVGSGVVVALYNATISVSGYHTVRRDSTSGVGAPAW